MANHQDYRYKFFSERSKGESKNILSPAIVGGWDTMTKIINDRYRAYWGDNFDMSSQPDALPAVLEFKFPPTEESFLKVKNSNVLHFTAVEGFLYEKGFRKGDFTYKSSGDEAIAFEVKGCPDLLLKISNNYILGYKSNMIVWPITKSVVQHPLEEERYLRGTADISVALVPYLAGKYNEDHEIGVMGHQRIQNFQHVDLPAEIAKIFEAETINKGDAMRAILSGIKTGWKELRSQNSIIQLPEQIEHLFKNLHISKQYIKDFLRYEGLEYKDDHPRNTRYFSDAPIIPMLIDHRAIENLEANKKGPKPPHYDEVNEAYNFVRLFVKSYLLGVYGPNKNDVFENVAKTCRALDGKEELPKPESIVTPHAQTGKLNIINIDDKKKQEAPTPEAVVTSKAQVAQLKTITVDAANDPNAWLYPKGPPLGR